MIDFLSTQDEPADKIQELVEKSVVLWDEENDAISAEKALLSAMAIEGGDRNVDVLISYGILQQEAFDNLVSRNILIALNFPHSLTELTDFLSFLAAPTRNSPHPPAPLPIHRDQIAAAGEGGTGTTP